MRAIPLGSAKEIPREYLLAPLEPLPLDWFQTTDLWKYHRDRMDHAMLNIMSGGLVAESPATLESDPDQPSEELLVLIDCMRPSAQDTLSALHRRGCKIVKA